MINLVFLIAESCTPVVAFIAPFIYHYLDVRACEDFITKNTWCVEQNNIYFYCTFTNFGGIGKKSSKLRHSSFYKIIHITKFHLSSII